MCARTARGLIATLPVPLVYSQYGGMRSEMINYFTLEWSCYGYMSELYISLLQIVCTL